ncbi:Pr6Pr family membrane protein [soil metagenome]
MQRQANLTRQIYNLLAAAVTWYSLGLSYYNGPLQKSGAAFVEGTVNYFSYFTILSNILVALSFTLAWLSPPVGLGRFFARPTIQAAIALYITVTGLTYWLIFADKGQVHWRDLGGWLIFPLAFVLYTLIHGAFSGFYPYPFLNVAVLGYPRVLLNSLLMAVAFVILGALLLAIARWLGQTKLVS